MYRFLKAALPFGLLALFLGHLADPGALLATRDVPIFHLPLRTALMQVAEFGAPVWNPMIHGGQPILSNPNYAAFYPPTWLLLLIPVHYSIGLIILLHAGIGFAGARRFARHLGCAEGPALMAGIGFAFGGATLATTSLLTTFCGLAWMPWILYGCDRWFAEAGRALNLRLAALPSAAFAAQILAGEPVIVLTTGLAAVSLALTAETHRAHKTARLVAISAVAVLLASAQLIPTYARLEGSARAEGLDRDETLEWSAHPRRVIELLWPRAWGDPMRIDEDLYFGWSVHDRQFPYLYSLYPGQLTVLLAFAALARWKIRHRLAWLAMIGGGLFLGAGAYNPLLLWLGRTTSLLSQIRYPEKLLLLSTVALVFAAALGWQRLLDARTEGDVPLEDFPVALAATLTGINMLLLIVLWKRPDVGEWFARTNSVLPLDAETQRHAATFLREELVTALIVSTASIVIFALHRWRSVPRLVLVPLTLALLVGDLYWYNRGLTPTVPAVDVMRPPAPLTTAAGDGERIFTNRSFLGSEPLILRSDRPGPATLWTQINRADPYLATLWNLQYVFHEDFDLMATGPARSAMSALRENWDDQETAHRILGAWSVRHLLTNRTIQDILRDRLAGTDGYEVSVAENPDYRARFRFEDRVQLHAGVEGAGRADRRSRFRESNWVAPDAGYRRLEPRSGSTELLEIQEQPALIRLRYRAEEVAPLTAAVTWDRGWRATVNGGRLPVYRTSLGMMGLLLPPGENILELRFKESSAVIGLALSLMTLAGMTAAIFLSASRRHQPG